MINIGSSNTETIVAAFDSSNFSAVGLNGSTTGVVGSRFRFTNVAADIWFVEGDIHHTGSAATPFATS